MELRKKYHPPIIVFCPKCCMPIFPTLGPNNLSVLMNGSKLSCSACKSEFDVRLEFTERAAEQLRAPAEPEQTCPSCAGTGTFGNDDEFPIKCHQCHGAGHV